MMDVRHGLGLAIGVLALCVAGTSGAQENLDQGKSAAQLFASDCVICHKSTQGLSRAGGLLGLQGFLREHYTASRESAAAIARYVAATDKGPAPAKRTRATATKRTPKGEEKAKAGEKAGEKKPETGKSGEAKSDETKSGEAKSGEAKATTSKPSTPKPSASKPSKPSEAKGSEPKASEAQGSTPKPAEAKTSAPKASDVKSGDKPEKSD